MSCYIKRMRLKGFKSFANPTVLNFEEGFNTIVGANGSGKSNVFDALCFVLGRMSSKGLRADKLGNLVFNGGKNLKAAKEAEVDIFLSNNNKELMNVDLDEVKISRIVKKSGQSNYLINNNKVTRTEVVEILRKASIDPDGYNIILQGDIMRIVNMTPIERRELIEEISDISGYEEKREKGIKKLDKVELDLKEADILMEEKTKYLKELKSEKEQAEKFHKVKDDLRFNNLLLVKAKLIRNTNLKKKKEEDLEKNEELLLEHKSKLDEFEKQIKDIENEITKIEKSIEVKSHNDFISVTNKITSLEHETQKLSEKKAEYKKQVEEIKSKNEGIKINIKENKDQKKKLELEIQELNLNKKEIEKELQEYENKISNLKKSISSESFKEIDEIEEQIDELQQKKYDKDLLRQDNSIQIEKLNTKIEHLQEDLGRIEQSNASNKDQLLELENYRKEQKKIIIEVSQRANENSELSAKLNSLQTEYSSLVENHTRLRMKADASRELMATNKAVDTISKIKAKDNSIHGTVAELGSAPEKYSLALETAAGKGLFNIVVENDSVAVKYINYLRENRIGNATFLPLNKVHAKYRLDDSVLNKKGVIDYALNLIQFDKQYENIFHLVFGDTLVIEKVEDAKGIGIGNYRMVTMSGDMVAKSGAMSGGFRGKSKGLGAFKDDEIVKKLERMDHKLSTLQSSIDHLRDEKESSEKILYDLRQRKIEVEGEVAKLEKVLSIEGRDTDTIKADMEAVLSDKTVIEGSLKKIDRDISELNGEISNLQERRIQLKGESGSHSDVLSKVSKLEEKRDNIKNKFMEISSKIDTKGIQINNVIIPETTNLEKIQRDGEQAIEKIKVSLVEVTESLKKFTDDLKDLQKKESELSKDYKGFIEKRDKLKEDRQKIEGKYEKEFDKYDKVKEKSSQLRYAIGEFDTLNQTLGDELEILYEELKIEFIENLETDEDKQTGEKNIENLISAVDMKLQNGNIDVKELQSRVNNLKTKMNSFGSINMKAVKIYDQLNEEFNRLLDKRQTLNSEKAEILDFIAEMDEKKKERFMETFEKLKEHFINIFSKLSTKGEVELNIENEKNLFESGVEIKVRLSKNNYLDIKSLSGGEKTITAIAFIFAVQEFNPASFYIFDEVDAALDIMNCEKLGKLIKESAHLAQYIVVSHSEYLIQSAQSIYGVTMDSNKISDILSLDLKNVDDYVDSGEKAEN